MALLKSAFCCATLQTGTLVVGWLTLIMVILSAIFATATFLAINEKDDEEMRESEMYEMLSLPREADYIYIFGFILETTENIVILICLLYGGYKSRSGFLMPYLVTFGVSVVSMAFLWAYQIIMRMRGIFLVYEILSVAIGIYFLCIVGSHYNQLRSNEGRAVKPESSAD